MGSANNNRHFVDNDLDCGRIGKYLKLSNHLRAANYIGRSCP